MHQTLCYGLANASQKGKDVAKLATSKQKIMTKSNQTVLFYLITLQMITIY